jgi:hypothetical protein
LGEGVYYCRNCRTVNDTQPWDEGKCILPVATADPNAIPVEIVRLHAPFRLTSTPMHDPEATRHVHAASDVPRAAAGANPADGQPSNVAELLAWCEDKMRVLAERVRLGGPGAANNDLVIHRIGRDADALARAFCPPELVLSLPVVPITFPHIYDHHKALTVLHKVAEWCRTQLTSLFDATERTTVSTLAEGFQSVRDFALDLVDSFAALCIDRTGDCVDLQGRNLTDHFARLGRACQAWSAPRFVVHPK